MPWMTLFGREAPNPYGMDQAHLERQKQEKIMAMLSALNRTQGNDNQILGVLQALAAGSMAGGSTEDAWRQQQQLAASMAMRKEEAARAEQRLEMDHQKFLADQIKAKTEIEQARLREADLVNEFLQTEGFPMQPPGARQTLEEWETARLAQEADLLGNQNTLDLEEAQAQAALLAAEKERERLGGALQPFYGDLTPLAVNASPTVAGGFITDRREDDERARELEDVALMVAQLRSEGNHGVADRLEAKLGLGDQQKVNELTGFTPAPQYVEPDPRIADTLGALGSPVPNAMAAAHANRINSVYLPDEIPGTPPKRPTHSEASKIVGHYTAGKPIDAEEKGYSVVEIGPGIEPVYLSPVAKAQAMKEGLIDMVDIPPPIMKAGLFGGVKDIPKKDLGKKELRWNTPQLSPHLWLASKAQEPLASATSPVAYPAYENGTGARDEKRLSLREFPEKVKTRVDDWYSKVPKDAKKDRNKVLAAAASMGMDTLSIQYLETLLR